MNRIETLERVMDTVETLKAEVVEAKAAGKSIGRMQRKAKLLGIIADLIETYCPDEFTLKTEADLDQALNPKKGKRVVIEVKEGDNALELLQKYGDVKDAWNKIKKACEDKGLTIKGQDIVRA